MTENSEGRRSTRLEGYDYSASGAYFVTVCVEGGACLLGSVRGERMHPNAAGHMIKQWWDELARKFPTLETDACVVMPNHFHSILMVGAAPCGRPGHPHRGAPTLGEVIGWFKTMTTNAYIRGVKEHGWPAFQGRFWQRNYYDRVLRDQRELDGRRQYVRDNPAQWALDPNNPATW